MQLIGGEVRDDGKDYGEVGKGFHGVEFTGSQDRVSYGGLLGGIVRSGEEVVFSSVRYRADGVFDQVVVDVKAAVVDVADKPEPKVECISQGYAESGCAAY